jgi:hypothetical protein
MHRGDLGAFVEIEATYEAIDLKVIAKFRVVILRGTPQWREKLHHLLR